MYSPFECITPTPARATPAQTPGQSIRMGTRPCKRLIISIMTIVSAVNCLHCIRKIREFDLPL